MASGLDKWLSDGFAWEYEFYIWHQAWPNEQKYIKMSLKLNTDVVLLQ